MPAKATKVPTKLGANTGFWIAVLIRDMALTKVASSVARSPGITERAQE
ncbi:hypothetical protein ABIB27_001392 [Arthrobacter sp. UYEF21]